jgi:hypothetical protein
LAFGDLAFDDLAFGDLAFGDLAFGDLADDLLLDLLDALDLLLEDLFCFIYLLLRYFI